jgi:hypothetical protein
LKAASNDDKASQNADIIIAVMGVTGAGKSTFITTVTERKDIPVGPNLYSETSEVNEYRFSHGSTNYVLVDTPGFDDSSMSNEEVTTKILRWLLSSYRSGTRLNGIIYIHNITKPRMQGSAYENMRLFRQLCGDGALGNVILATSFWDQVTPSVGAERESKLKEDFWANMIAKGSEVVRIKRDRSVCLEVLDRIAAKNRVDLLVQREMVVQKKKLKDTTVGKNTMSSEIQKFEKTMEKETKAEKKRLQRKLEEGQKAHKKEMKKLRTQQEKGQRQAQQSQRRAEKEHKRNVREDQRQMQQERWEVVRSIGQANPTPKDDSYIVMNYLYALACFWTFFITALLGNVINNASGGTPAQINFSMFVTVVSWLFGIFGLVASSYESTRPALVATDAFAVLFTFLAAIVLSAKLGVHSCFNYDYISTNDTITGSPNLTKRCQELQACAAFFWFLFFTYCVELGVNAASLHKMDLDRQRTQYV